ncbi:MAG TPA: glutathione-disulfide reductase [Hyphomicrobiaceae bacterium]|nr:glutathione-disulfide reductase [Hyphomicrobiaceae bacterium]
MSRYDYDLFVIGGGSGGVRAARIAAGYGAKVAIAEEYRFGGTCVIRGCVPKKLLVYASRFRDEFEDAAGFGWSVPEARFDWPTLVAAKDREIARLESVYRAGLEKAGVAIFKTRATLTGSNTILLADSGQKLSARVVLIATGAKPNVDERLIGIEHVITSNEAFHLPQLPRRVGIAGGGYIAVEFAGIFAGLGSEVTLVYRGDKILRGFDDDLRDGITEAYARRGIRIVTGNVFARIERKGKELAAHLSNGSRILVDRIMFAIGRSPNTAGLGLEAAGVRLNNDGAVEVDEYSASSVPGIYAVGDVTDRVNLTPVALHDGHAFADTVFGGRPRAVDHASIPTAVFSTPEIASVGLPEHLARQRCRQLDVYKTTFRPLRHTLSGRDERMLMKLLVDGETGRVVGCHVLGPDAAEIVQTAAVAIRMGARKADFDATMALHPTAAEELVTMRTKSRG